MPATRQCSMFSAQCSINDQWSMVNDKLLKIDNCKLTIEAARREAV